MDELVQRYVDSLSQMINLRTVASNDKKVFDDFHKLLRKLFPNVFKKFKYEEFNGSILLSYIVKNDLDPVLLMSHHDVVSENGKWEHEAFKAEVIDGKLYGRGTLDTKGNLWAILTALEELIEEGVNFNRSIYVESSCNEETSGAGAHEIAQELLRRKVHFDFTMDEGGMIVYEPIDGAKGTFAMVALGEKDYIDLRFVAKSKGGHSSTPDKNNPLLRLSKFVVYVENHKLFKPKLCDTTIETFRRCSSSMKGGMKFIFKHAKGLKHLLAIILDKLSPVSSSLVKSTICFTRAKGSDEYNAIPTRAYVCGNIRVAHHDNKEEIVQKLSNIAKKFDIDCEVVDEGYHSDICDFRTKQFKFLEELISENFEGVITAPYISTGASDSKYFNELSENIFRFAPIIATNEQLDTTHAKDENIDVSTLPKAVNFFKNLVRKL